VFARPILALSFLLSSHNVAPVHHPVRPLVSTSEWLKVVRVAQCEEGGNWRASGPTYQGGLGWLHSTWMAYRAPWMPVWMNQATPEEQAWAMVRFIQRAQHWWPDQTGCTGAY
jgi:hypothetical protein